MRRSTFELIPLLTNEPNAGIAPAMVANHDTNSSFTAACHPLRDEEDLNLLNYSAVLLVGLEPTDYAF